MSDRDGELEGEEAHATQHSESESTSAEATGDGTATSATAAPEPPRRSRFSEAGTGWGPEGPGGGMHPLRSTVAGWLPLVTWDAACAPPGGPGPMPTPEGLAVLQSISGRVPRVLFVGGNPTAGPSGGPAAAGPSAPADETSTALAALLGVAVLPSADVPALWVWPRLVEVPMPTATSSHAHPIAGPSATALPDSSCLILYAAVPPPAPPSAKQAPAKQAPPPKAAGRRVSLTGAANASPFAATAATPPGAPNPAAAAAAIRSLLSSALLVASCVVVSESVSAPAQSPSPSALVKIRLVSSAYSDLNMHLAPQPNQLLYLTPVSPAKYKTFCDGGSTAAAAAVQQGGAAAASASSKMSAADSKAAQQQEALATFEQQQLEALPEQLVSALQRQVELRVAPVPCAAPAAPAAAAPPSHKAAAAAPPPPGSAGAALKAALQGALARITVPSTSRVCGAGSASCVPVRGAWLSRLLQVYTNGKPRSGSRFMSMGECRSEAEAFRATDAVEEALHEYRRRMTPLDQERIATQHADAVAAACRAFMALVIEVRNVHSISDNFRLLKTRCDEECAALAQAEEARQALGGRGGKGRPRSSHRSLAHQLAKSPAAAAAAAAGDQAGAADSPAAAGGGTTPTASGLAHQLTAKAGIRLADDPPAKSPPVPVAALDPSDPLRTSPGKLGIMLSGSGGSNSMDCSPARQGSGAFSRRSTASDAFQVLEMATAALSDAAGRSLSGRPAAATAGVGLPHIDKARLYRGSMPGVSLPGSPARGGGGGPLPPVRTGSGSLGPTPRSSHSGAGGTLPAIGARPSEEGSGGGAGAHACAGLSEDEGGRLSPSRQQSGFGRLGHHAGSRSSSGLRLTMTHSPSFGAGGPASPARLSQRSGIEGDDEQTTTAGLGERLCSLVVGWDGPRQASGSALAQVLAQAPPTARVAKVQMQAAM